ncbi:MAG: hypothetical protein ACRERD_22735 [Candidatus Binatia bacterium]
MTRLFALFVGLLVIYGFDAPTISPREVVQMWTQLYGQDTARAALLTTGRFRQWQEPQRWAERKQEELSKLRFQHLGGEVVKAWVSEKSATIFFDARVRTSHGVATRIEVYGLRRINGQWLIDVVRVTDEIRPRKASALASAVRIAPRFI